MRWRSLVSLLVLLLMFATWVPGAFAIRSAGFYGEAGIVSPDTGDDSAIIGAGWLFEQQNTLWRFTPEVMYWSAANVNDFVVNVNGYYYFSPRERMSPYAGAGIGLNFYSFDRVIIAPGVTYKPDGTTDFAGNLLGGVRGAAWTNGEWFAEARYVLTDNNQLMVMGGLTVLFGRGGSAGQDAGY